MPVQAPSFLRRSVERLLQELSPSWHASREALRLRAERTRAVREALIEHRERRSRRRFWDDLELRNYDAASMTPRTEGWRAPRTPPDAAVSMFLDRLRQRSRDLTRNNPWAAKAVRAIPAHLVGPGIRATLEHANPAVAERAQALWDEWAESKLCDADGRTNFYGLQRLAARSVVEAGEVLARFRMRRSSDGMAVPLQVQLLEADFLDSTKDNAIGFAARPSGRLQRQGVEFDQRGQRVGYWLFDSHPSLGLAGSGTSNFIPADRVAHVYRVDRPGQVRGIPWGAPCLLTLRDLGDWADATILRCKLAACFAAFVTTDIDPEDPDATKATPTGKDIESLEPGHVEYLTPGQQVTLTNPPGVEGMEDFPKLTLRAVAVGYGVPLHVLSGDLTEVNFSSARIGNLDFDADLGSWREDWLVPDFCQLAADNWRMQAERAGVIPDGVTFSWTPPPEAMIEPKVDAEVQAFRLRNGQSTPQEVSRRNGWRWRQFIREWKQGWKELDDAGIVLDSDPRRAAAGTPGSVPSPKSGEQPPSKPKEDKPAPARAEA